MKKLLLTIALLLPTLSWGDITSNLVAEYPLTVVNGTTTVDISGNNHNGTTSGSPGFTSGKVYSNGMTFNGSNQYVNTSYVSSFGSGSFTMSAWVKTSSSNSGATMLGIYNISSTPNAVFMIMYQDSTNYGFTFRDSNGVTSSGQFNSSSIVDSTWHLVTIVVDRSTNHQYGYLDGVLTVTSSSTFTGSFTVNSLPFIIGADFGISSYTDYYNGAVEDARLYNRALTASDVIELYNFRHGSTTLQ